MERVEGTEEEVTYKPESKKDHSASGAKTSNRQTRAKQVEQSKSKWSTNKWIVQKCVRGFRGAQDEGLRSMPDATRSSEFHIEDQPSKLLSQTCQHCCLIRWATALDALDNDRRDEDESWQGVVPISTALYVRIVLHRLKASLQSFIDEEGWLVGRGDFVRDYTQCSEYRGDLWGIPVHIVDGTPDAGSHVGKHCRFVLACWRGTRVFLQRRGLLNPGDCEEGSAVNIPRRGGLSRVLDLEVTIHAGADSARPVYGTEEVLNGAFRPEFTCILEHLRVKDVDDVSGLGGDGPDQLGERALCVAFADTTRRV